MTHAADDTIEEIVVTARKRTENLQDVPDSITAFSASMIEERRIDRIADAIEVTPGVHMISDQDAGTNIITVRGIGTNRNLPASIAFVVDGVVLPDSDAFTADLSDVERIEILKGPQGGLYGRNAIGGVINLTTREPTNQLEGDVKVGYSSGETKDVFGAISGSARRRQPARSRRRQVPRHRRPDREHVHRRQHGLRREHQGHAAA